jgi:acyl-[acyl-carrier-protein]-phospholipid O-acyltransferase/long-chain-fatty-acid--[acyl-carrier-protein] ligase
LNVSPEAQHVATTEPDKARGETIALIITDEALTRETLLKSAQTLGIAEITVPEKIQPVDSVPTLSVGKMIMQS